MQAMKGVAGALRSRGRVVGACFALALAAGGTLAQSADAHEKVNKKTESYIALGDSLAFGYSQEQYNLHEAQGDPVGKWFEDGYVNYLWKKIDKPVYDEGTRLPRPMNLENLGCPGETSSSLIGNGLVGAILESFPHPATTEAPCAYEEAWGELHTPGDGGPIELPYYGQSQLEDALKRVHADEQHPVKMITLDIGASDELRLFHECEVSGEPSCLSERAPAVIATITTNVTDAIYLLRHAHEFEEGWADYTGPIILVAPYDPYGVVFKAGEDEYPPNCTAREVACAVQGSEEVPGSNAIAGALTQSEDTALAGEIEANSANRETGLCLANMQSVFNPAYNPAEPGVSTAGARAREAKDLKTWTNMANKTGVLEGTLESTYRGNPGEKADGPDANPTIKGYRLMAARIWKDCR